MNLYQINCPVFTNDGQHNYEEALKVFQGFLMDKVGGFTKFPMVHGHWADPTTGRVTIDLIIPVQFAVKDTRTADLILDRAFELFKDQKAIFLAKVGTAIIHERPKEE